MQKVFKECLTLDQRVRDIYGLSSEVMMEHAALGIKAIIPSKSGLYSGKVVILCGPGDNGADGYALARLLMAQYDVLILSLYTPISIQAIKQRERAEALGISVIDCDESLVITRLQEMSDVDIYVDALFGASQHRLLSPLLKKVIAQINRLPGFKIACDFPTGMYDYPFMADITVTMGALKQDIFLDNVKDAVGNIVVADLGIPRHLYEIETDTYLLDEKDLQLPFRAKKNTNKGDYGFLSVIKGEQTGASILSSLAGTRFGAGIVALIGQGGKPSEVMQMPELSPKTTAIVAGMGLGESRKFHNLSQWLDYPLVVDADLFYDKAFIQSLKRKKDVVFTPHPKEFIMLLQHAQGNRQAVLEQKEALDYIQKHRFELARQFSEYYSGVLILKGANTIIAHEGTVYICTLGTNALAKGGSGDVLAGMVGALLAQGISPIESAIQSVIAHSLSARNSTMNDYSFTPLDLIEGLKTLSLNE